MVLLQEGLLVGGLKLLQITRSNASLLELDQLVIFNHSNHMRAKL